MAGLKTNMEIEYYNIALLREFMHRNKRIPNVDDMIGAWRIGRWYHDVLIRIRREPNCQLAQELRKIPVVAADIMRSVEKMSFEEELVLFTIYMFSHHEPPAPGEIYNGWKIGEWYERQKAAIAENPNSPIHRALSINSSVAFDLSLPPRRGFASLVPTRSLPSQRFNVDISGRSTRITPSPENVPPPLVETPPTTVSNTTTISIAPPEYSTDDESQQESTPQVPPSGSDCLSETSEDVTPMKLFEFVNIHCRVPRRNEKLGGVEVGEYYFRQKLILQEDIFHPVYNTLVVNPVVAKDINTAMLEAASSTTLGEKLKLFKMFMEINDHNIPRSSYIFRGWRIYNWLQRLRVKCDKEGSKCVPPEIMAESVMQDFFDRVHTRQRVGDKRPRYE